MLTVFTTTSSLSEAEELAQSIVAERLAACVQIVPSIRSFYVWEGEVADQREHLMVIKTFREKYFELESFIKATHTYDIPEIVAIESENISTDYLNWMNEAINGN